jgi:hypothetical protein
MKFSPQLLPNNPAGITPDWEALLTPISDYMASDKADGGRVECGEDGSALGRSLKPIPSEQSNDKRPFAVTQQDTLKLNCTAPT